MYSEILSPAGNIESLKAAVRTGADAVYIGVQNFNARQNAGNFTLESAKTDDTFPLKDAVDYCHLSGVKVYLTLNTLLREEEIYKALTVAEAAAKMGIDAFIIQDLGLAKLISESKFGVPLHASTQLSCHTPEGVKALIDLGFSRIVLSREMTKEEIILCENLGAEIEVFVHGALCMSVSGQCYMSAILGGRSGNRGLCAQPCRLPFAVGHVNDKNQNVLSLKDLTLLDYIKELTEIGVDSFKIEGRMKRPEYVASTTASFVSARNKVLGLKNYFDFKAPKKDDLKDVFSRSGFTDGYFTGKRNKDMFGVRSYEDVVAAKSILSKMEKLYEIELSKIKIAMHLVVKRDVFSSLEVTDIDGNHVKVSGDIPELAKNADLNAERAKSYLEKVGGTPYIPEVTSETEKGLFLSAASLNKLRRDALVELSKLRENKSVLGTKNIDVDFTKPHDISEIKSLKKDENLKTMVLLSPLYKFPPPKNADVVIFPLSADVEYLIKYKDKYREIGVEIPRGMFLGEEYINKQLINVKKAGITLALCGNIGSVRLAKNLGFKVVTNFSLNVMNSESVSALKHLGVSAVVLSQELSFSQMKFAEDISIPKGILAYGRQPLMLLRNCPIKSNIGCKNCDNFGSKGKNAVLTDRKNISFPINCYDEISGSVEVINSRPLYIADIVKNNSNLDFYMFYLSDENETQAEKVIEDYKNQNPASYEFTRGMYKKGVI